MAARIVLKKQPARVVARGLRVWLRPPEPEDEAEFTALRRASRSFLAPSGIAASPSRAFRLFLQQGPGTGRERWLVCSKADGEILGAVSLQAIRGEPFHSAVIGYWIGAVHARQGYMGEALSLAVRRAFRGLGVNRLEADVLPENTASKRLLARAGFVREGTAREFVRIDGRFCDHERWALLARDFARGVRPTRAQRPQSRK